MFGQSFTLNPRNVGQTRLSWLQRGYEEFYHASDTVVRARIDGHVKKEAAPVLYQMGLTVSDAIRLLMVRIAREKALPFDVRVPNLFTTAAKRVTPPLAAGSMRSRLRPCGSPSICIGKV